MSSLMPSLVYPPDASTGNSYYYNYNDLVNVTLSWNGPPGATVFLILWLLGSGASVLFPRSNNTIFTAGNSSYLSSLNFTNLEYPGSGHFNIWAHFKNGTVVRGPNSAQVVVGKNEAAGSQCYNCISKDSGSISSASPTGTTTSNGATIPVTTSETPLPSPQSTSSGGGLSGGAIAGIVVGVIVALAIAGICGLFYQRKRTGGRTSHKMTSTEGAQGSQEGAHRSDQKTELDGVQLHELHDSAQPLEKDASNRPLMSSVELGTNR